MFTPPPSPDPRRAQLKRPSAISSNPNLDINPSVDHPPSPLSTTETPHSESHPTPLSPSEDPYTHALLHKKRVGRRIRWSIILLPLLLLGLALSTRYISHPAVFDIISHPTPNWSSFKRWSLRKRHADPAPASSATTVAQVKQSATALSVSPSASDAPSPIDTTNTKVPWNRPVLPTPFPQPFDSTLSSNFTTVACQNFISNMTLAPPFRQCRPFSMLVSDSNAFITSQRNISDLNIILWGTCNTDLSAEQCVSNMGWFAENIQTQCKGDIAANNVLVRNALAGLQSYTVMREVACQVNANTDMYCYVEAAQSTHPSDLYLYQLPLGLPLPNTTVPSCTPCVQNLMNAYAKDGLTATELQDTYPPAAVIVNQACGTSFVATINVVRNNGAAAARDGGMGWGVGAAAGIALLVGQWVL